MKLQQKDSYTEPVLIAHELLRDITATTTGKGSEKSGVEKSGEEQV